MKWFRACESVYSSKRSVYVRVRSHSTAFEERARKEAEIRHDKELVDAKHRRDSALHQKRAEETLRLSRIQLELDINRLRDRKFTNKMLVDQVDLHRQFNNNLPLKSKLGTKALLLDALTSAIEFYNSLPAHDKLAQGSNNNVTDVDMITHDHDEYDSDSFMD